MRSASSQSSDVVRPPLWVRLNRLRVNRWLAWFHRWAGVVLGLFFALWFVSGAVLHFVGFPALSATDRRSGSEEIDFSRLRVKPSEAIAAAPNASGLRLISAAGRPVYVVSIPGHSPAAIDGDSGQVMAPLSAMDARTVAERFSHARVAAVDGPTDYDQWTVHQRFDPYRPFYRVHLGDDARTDLYVSTRTGEVVQRTRSAERRWNWCGAVLHWIYFTPLRSNWVAWDQVVWWLSLAALLSSLMGAWLGLVRFAGARAGGNSRISPFRGWMRWHHIIGLFVGLVVIAWILSGWLSMDHGRLFSRGDATDDEVTRMRGLPVAAIAEATPLESMRALAPASEIPFNAVAGQAFLTAWKPAAATANIHWLNSLGVNLGGSVPDSLLLAGVRGVWPGAERLAPSTAAYDSLYRLAESAPEDAIAFRAADQTSERVYVDPSSGRLLAVMDPSRRAYAWIYYAVHTFNFPGLSTSPHARTTVVLGLLAAGLVFCGTGVVLGVLRLKRELPQARLTFLPRAARSIQAKGDVK